MEAYEKLKFYQNIKEIRRFIYKVTERFKKSHLRLISQMRDSARSAKQNIREGYKKDTLGEYMHSVKISRGSLDELKGDWEDCCEDGLVSKEENNYFMSLMGKTDYMISRYIDSLYKLEANGKWKNRFREIKRPQL